MKFKLAAVMTVGYVLATAACAQAQKIYWVRADNSAFTLADPKTLGQLNQAIASCTLPGEEPSFQHERDFEGCMLSKGWKQKEIGRPQAAENTEKNTFAENLSGQEPLSPEGRQQFNTAAHAARQIGLIPNGPQVTIGLQGYHDRYFEHASDVNVRTKYFGVTAAYSERIDKNNFWMADGRLDHGFESYISPSGTLSGVPEYEGELRLTVGRDHAWENSWFSPYMGLGTRIFRGNGKGFVTNLGAYAYDRRIEQLYLPLGATWRTLLSGRTSMAATLEFDPLLIGRVNSREQNGGGPNVVNTQDPASGYGVRGDIMFGLSAQNQLIELGPFFRYWNISDSTYNIQSCMGLQCNAIFEPYNKRLQIGANARVSF